MVFFAVKTKIKETMDNNKNAIKRDKAELAQSLESGSILSKVVILGTAHGINTPGKCSPDKKFREYKFSREVINILKPWHQKFAYTTTENISVLFL